MNPWQYEHEVCKNGKNSVSQFCKGKEFVVMATTSKGRKIPVDRFL